MSELRAVRTETIEALLALWRNTAGIRDLEQFQTFDIEEMSEEGVYVAEIEGTDEYEFLMGGTDVTFEDQFTLEFVVAALAPGQTAAEARGKCEGFMLAMRRAVAGDVGLGGIVDDALEVVSATASGPDVISGTEGWGAIGTLQFQVLATIGAFT